MILYRKNSWRKDGKEKELKDDSIIKTELILVDDQMRVSSTFPTGRTLSIPRLTLQLDTHTLGLVKNIIKHRKKKAYDSCFPSLPLRPELLRPDQNLNQGLV